MQHCLIKQRQYDKGASRYLRRVFFSSDGEGNTMACDKSARTKFLRPGQILSVKAGQDGNR